MFGLSLLDFLHLGSSLSVRSFARVGSCLAVCGGLRFSGAMSVLDVRPTPLQPSPFH